MYLASKSVSGFVPGIKLSWRHSHHCQRGRVGSD